MVFVSEFEIKYFGYSISFLYKEFQVDLDGDDLNENTLKNHLYIICKEIFFL